MPPQAHMAAHVYSTWLRMLVAALVALSRGSLWLILVRVLVATDPPITPPILFRLFILFTAVPAALAWLLQRASAGGIEVQPDNVIVARRRSRMEIPCDAIDDVVPWSVPLPGPGISLRMRSGGLLTRVFEIADPKPLLYALADRGHVEAARAPVRHPVVVWAHAKAAVARWRWYHYFAKYVIFAFAPAAILFNTHQHISYGGLLGQYYLEGLGPYLRTLLVYWSTVAIYLVLYASLLRGVAEGFALAAAAVVPLAAPTVRRVVEVACRILFYAGVPVLLALRYRA